MAGQWREGAEWPENGEIVIVEVLSSSGLSVGTESTFLSWKNPALLPLPPRRTIPAPTLACSCFIPALIPPPNAMPAKPPKAAPIFPTAAAFPRNKSIFSATGICINRGFPNSFNKLFKATSDMSFMPRRKTFSSVAAAAGARQCIVKGSALSVAMPEFKTPIDGGSSWRPRFEFRYSRAALSLVSAPTKAATSITSRSSSWCWGEGCSSSSV